MSMTIAPEITTRTPASQGKVKQWMHARSVPVIAAAGALAASVIQMVNVLQMVHWSPAQVAAVTAESGGIIAFVTALLAHFRVGTAKEPVAIAATFTALVTVSLAFGSAFTWWTLTQEQQAAVVGTIAALTGVGSAAFARSHVHAAVADQRPRNS